MRGEVYGWMEFGWVYGENSSCLPPFVVAMRSDYAVQMSLSSYLARCALFDTMASGTIR